jgi:hypothetical protein
MFLPGLAALDGQPASFAAIEREALAAELQWRHC